MKSTLSLITAIFLALHILAPSVVYASSGEVYIQTSLEHERVVNENAGVEAELEYIVHEDEIELFEEFMDEPVEEIVEAEAVVEETMNEEVEEVIKAEWVREKTVLNIPRVAEEKSISWAYPSENDQEYVIRDLHELKILDNTTNERLLKMVVLTVMNDSWRFSQIRQNYSAIKTVLNHYDQWINEFSTEFWTTMSSIIWGISVKLVWQIHVPRDA